MSTSGFGSGRPAAADGRPLPGGDVLALLGKGSEGLSEDGKTTRDGDPHSVAYELGWWEAEWREVRDEPATRGPRSARAEVRDAAAYLERRSLWASREHHGFDEFASDLRRLHAELEGATGRSLVRQVAEAECFDCGGELERRLTAAGYEDRWTCRRCHRPYDWPRYLLALRAHLQAHPAQGWSLPEHVALTLGINAKTVRTWATRGQVASACVFELRTVDDEPAVRADKRLRVWYPEVAVLAEELAARAAARDERRRQRLKAEQSEASGAATRQNQAS